jgi:hypothetical protein
MSIWWLTPSLQARWAGERIKNEPDKAKIVTVLHGITDTMYPKVNNQVIGNLAYLSLYHNDPEVKNLATARLQGYTAWRKQQAGLPLDNIVVTGGIVAVGALGAYGLYHLVQSRHSAQ